MLCLQELHGLTRRRRTAARAVPADGAPVASSGGAARRGACSSVTARRGARRLPRPARRRPGRPEPRAGQFAMLAAAERWGGGEDERPFLAARLLDRPPRATGEAPLPARGRRPGHARGCASCGAGRAGLGSLGPLGRGFTPPAAGAGAMLVGGGVGIAPLAILQDQLEAGIARRPCSASATRRHASRARALLRGRAGSPPTTARTGTTASSPICSRAELERGRRRRRLRLRARRDARGRAGRCASARGVPAQLALEARRWPAASAPATAASCRPRRRLPARLRRRARCSTPRELEHVERACGGAGVSVEFCGLRARAPGHQRLGHVRRDRRAGAPSATACADAFPFAAYVSKTITLRAARRATRRRGCGRRRRG